MPSSTVDGSVIDDNLATGYGGGIHECGDGTTLINTTVTGNSVVIGNGYGGLVGGGGIYIEGSGSFAAINCTITDNCSATDSVNGGGGGGIIDVTRNLYLINTIVASNTDSVGPDVFNLANAAFVTANHSLIGDPSDSGISTDPAFGNILNPSTIGLGVLDNYGGPTQTIALLPGSPAIGAGSAITVLSGTGEVITDDPSDNVITVDNGITFAANALPLLNSGNYFTIQIDGEQMQVVGLGLNSDGTATLNVNRAAKGTTIAEHDGDTSVFLVSDQRGVPGHTTPMLSSTWGRLLRRLPPPPGLPIRRRTRRLSLPTLRPMLNTIPATIS